MQDPEKINQQMAQVRNVARWVCLHPDPGEEEFRTQYQDKMAAIIRTSEDATVAISALARYAAGVILLASGRPEESIGHAVISLATEDGTDEQQALAKAAVHLITLAMGHDYVTLTVLADGITQNGPEVASELITILVTIARDQSKGLAVNLPIRAY